MAKIFKTDNQEQALKDIVDSLKVVDSLNKIINNEDITEYKVRLNGESEMCSLNETFIIPSNLILNTLSDHRKKLIKEIKDKSKTYHIELDDKELDIINNNKKVKKVEPKEKVDTVENKEIVEPDKTNSFNNHQTNDYGFKQNTYY